MRVRVCVRACVCCMSVHVCECVFVFILLQENLLLEVCGFMLETLKYVLIVHVCVQSNLFAANTKGWMELVLNDKSHSYRNQ